MLTPHQSEDCGPSTYSFGIPAHGGRAEPPLISRDWGRDAPPADATPPAARPSAFAFASEESRQLKAQGELLQEALRNQRVMLSVLHKLCEHTDTPWRAPPRPPPRPVHVQSAQKPLGALDARSLRALVSLAPLSRLPAQLCAPSPSQPNTHR